MSEETYAALLKSLAGSDVAASIMTTFYSSRRQGSPNLAASALVTDVMYACVAQCTARLLSSPIQQLTTPTITTNYFGGTYRAHQCLL